MNSDQKEQPDDKGIDDKLSFAVIGAAQKVHRVLGPGFAEATYEAALRRELATQRIPFEPQKQLEVYYDNVPCGTYQPDMSVDGSLIVELKAVSVLCPEHKAQTVSYLKASGLPRALLLNFGQTSLIVRRYELAKLKGSDAAVSIEDEVIVPGPSAVRSSPPSSSNPVNPRNPVPSSPSSSSNPVNPRNPVPLSSSLPSDWQSRSESSR